MGNRMGFPTLLIVVFCLQNICNPPPPYTCVLLQKWLCSTSCKWQLVVQLLRVWPRCPNEIIVKKDTWVCPPCKGGRAHFPSFWCWLVLWFAWANECHGSDNVPVMWLGFKGSCIHQDSAFELLPVAGWISMGCSDSCPQSCQPSSSQMTEIASKWWRKHWGYICTRDTLWCLSYQ